MFVNHALIIVKQTLIPKSVRTLTLRANTPQGKQGRNGDSPSRMAMVYVW